MEIYNEINDKNKNLALALGFFDGIHIGHRAVLNSAINYAKSNDLKSAVITFENHPRCFFKKCEPEYILSKHDKLKIFEDMGFDYVYFLKFDEKLSKLSASEYLEFLKINLNPKSISTGFNHYFGHNREGNAEFLKQNQKKYAYEYLETPQIEIDNKIVSSSTIREDLKSGNIELVNKMLGHKYSLTETVVEGEKIGRTIGFRTANLLYPKNMLNVSRGVYSVEVEYNGQLFKGIANFGMRPSLENTKIPVLEVHILNFEKDIYGEKIKVSFLKKIRDEKKFPSLNELKTQISKDISIIN